MTPTLPLSLPLDRPTVATFVKTDSHQVVEVLALCALDYAVLDAEHAPFDRASMDRMLFAARAVGLPMLVRVPDRRDATILSVLDLGAAGIVVPHVDSAAQAREVVAAARFIGGRRGLSLSARYGGYGTRSRDEAVAEGDRSLVVCQIESEAALAAVDAIAAVPGVGALLIGRADLALSLGVDGPRHARVLAAVDRIIAAARERGLPVIMAIGADAEVAEFRARGAQSFIVGSDQSLLRGAASRLRTLVSA
ncbi:MAG: aldolase [Burkholderiales bacterium]|nr:aldolase [Burkholderiales bacterium]